MSYKRHEEKKESRQVVVIDKIPEKQVTQRSQHKICQATTMSGKPCSFKAICGDFCKKHRIDKVPIGKKVQLKS
jgi:sulfatase maturation enzyme AslB (radical SAM superfamily)